MIRYQSAAALWGHEPTYRSEFWQTVGFLRMSDDPSGGAGGVSANAAITQATSFIIRDRAWQLDITVELLLETVAILFLRTLWGLMSQSPSVPGEFMKQNRLLYN